ncbi:MAG: hypothetical protein Q7R96_01770 [Nanoarchaeota archaeon]|nr:hypothetical protein [Nanoarchaeota archaeon]
METSTTIGIPMTVVSTRTWAYQNNLGFMIVATPSHYNARTVYSRKFQSEQEIVAIMRTLEAHCLTHIGGKRVLGFLDPSEKNCIDNFAVDPEFGGCTAQHYAASRTPGVDIEVMFL